MLARLHVLLPYSVVLPDGESYQIYAYEDNGYEVRVLPPLRSDEPGAGVSNDQKMIINDKSGIQANILRVDFIKESFDRRSGIDCDPPYELIRRTINHFLRKLRFVTRGFMIKEIDFPRVSWRIQYLNDDETELEHLEGMVRFRGARAFQFSWTALTPEIWNDIYSLPVDYSPPEWDNLYLDAVAALPDVGPAIVLAATSLETFIAYILDVLVKKTTVPPDLWQWINSRDWLKAPTPTEQYDVLLRILLGVSLKDDPTLWEAFQNIKNARNSFVHEGVAQIGGKPITDTDARKLVQSVAKITKFIKLKMPSEFQWPEFEHTANVEMQMNLFGEKEKSEGT